jgi:hypothetical protein
MTKAGPALVEMAAITLQQAQASSATVQMAVTAITMAASTAADTALKSWRWSASDARAGRGDEHQRGPEYMQGVRDAR